MPATDTDKRRFLDKCRELNLTRATKCPTANILVDAWFASQPHANIDDLIHFLEQIIALLPTLQALIALLDQLKPALAHCRQLLPAIRPTSPTAFLELLQLLAESCDKEPEPGPGPIPPTDALVALFVYDNEQLQKLPPAQQSILSSKPLRDLLDTECAKGPTGLPMYRFLESGADLSKEEPIFQTLWLQPRPSLPWMYLVRGDDLLSQAWPPDPIAVAALLKLVND